MYNGRIHEMTIDEITTVLNSGKYVSSTSKKMMQDRLEYLYRNGRYSAINDSLNSTIRNVKLDANKKPSVKIASLESFPSLGETISPPKTSKKKMNFSRIINPDQNDSIFENDTVRLDFFDIIKLYDDYGIYRIKLYFDILQKKIWLLDSIRIAKNNKAHKFEQHFDYKKLVFVKDMMEQCINIWNHLERQTHYVDVMAQTIETCIVNLKADTFTENIIFDNMKYLLDHHNSATFKDELFFYEYNIYLDAYQKILDDINHIINAISNCQKNRTVNGMKHQMIIVKKLQQNILTLQNTIVRDFDPHIDCQYYAVLQNDGDHIVSKGIFKHEYFDCTDRINTSFNKLDISDSYLRIMTLEQFDLFFDYPLEIDCTNFFCINLALHDNMTRLFYVYYDFVDQIPFQKGTLEISNVPAGTPVMTSIIVNNKQKTDETPTMKPKPQIHINNWLQTRTTNSLYTLRQNEYDNLDPALQDAYDISETDQNIFYTDYAFQELMTHNPSLITPSMLRSFRHLACATSR